MRGVIAGAVCLLMSAGAPACQPEDFFADVLMWGESSFAGLIFSGCPKDARLKIKVRINSKNYAPLATEWVEVRVPARDTVAFQGAFPKRKMAWAVPDHRQVWIVGASIAPAVVRPAAAPDPLPASAFAELAALTPAYGRR